MYFSSFSNFLRLACSQVSPSRTKTHRTRPRLLTSSRSWCALYPTYSVFFCLLTANLSRSPAGVCINRRACSCLRWACSASGSWTASSRDHCCPGSSTPWPSPLSLSRYTHFSLSLSLSQKMATSLIFALQIDSLLGIPNPAAHDWHKLIHVFNNVSDVVWQSAVVGMFTPAHRAHYYRRLIAACVCRCERDHSPLRIQDCQQADQPIGDH